MGIVYMVFWLETSTVEDMVLQVESAIQFLLQETLAIVSEHVLHPLLKLKPENLFISHHVLSLY